jgi:hypothetical protein
MTFEKHYNKGFRRKKELIIREGAAAKIHIRN